MITFGMVNRGAILLSFFLLNFVMVCSGKQYGESPVPGSTI